MGRSQGVEGVVDDKVKVVAVEASASSTDLERAEASDEVSSKVTQPGSPVKSHAEGASTQDALPQQTPVNKGGRSVKSIVDWIESSGPSPSPTKGVISTSTTALTTKSPKPGVKASQPLSTISQLKRPRVPSSNVPNTADVDDDELSYLKYQEYFSDKPLGRRLDGVTEDLSKLPVEDIFKNAEKAVHSEPTRVRVHGIVGEAKGIAEEAAGSDDAVAKEPTGEQLSRGLGAMLPEPTQAEDNAEANAKPAAETNPAMSTDAPGSSDAITRDADCAAGTEAGVAATLEDKETFIQRNPEEVKAF
ncbi:hypothetical protein ACCO45_005844 [Purpureocillium lilacinum]|uniref:Uncharacterized protein n=1 Tax=Purpureocillium lilacinum TaxID=33203 RepID=A0ACC4DWJ6_PURLI